VLYSEKSSYTDEHDCHADDYDYIPVEFPGTRTPGFSLIPKAIPNPAKDSQAPRDNAMLEEAVCTNEIHQIEGSEQKPSGKRF